MKKLSKSRNLEYSLVHVSSGRFSKNDLSSEGEENLDTFDETESPNP